MADHAKMKTELKIPPASVANTAFGVIGGGLGAAAATGIGPIILPFAVLGGFAGFLMSSKIPSK
jgi:hypothetical protein